MKKRLPFMLWIVALVVGVVGLFVWARNIPTTKTSPINRSTFEQIKNGMTLKEVEELIGSPPVVDSSPSEENVLGHVRITASDKERWNFPQYHHHISWKSKECDIDIYFSMEDIVVFAELYETIVITKETFWEKPERWFTLW